MRLEVQTQVKCGLAQRTGRAQQKCNQQPSQPAIAVEERVNRFELYMNEAGLDQDWKVRSFLMNERLQVGHAVHQALRRWWNKDRFTGACPADPVLASPELARLLSAAAALASNSR